MDFLYSFIRELQVLLFAANGTLTTCGAEEPPANSSQSDKKSHYLG